MKHHIAFYEVFEEEGRLLKSVLPSGWSVDLNRDPIGPDAGNCPPAPILCVRTQSRIPVEWAPRIQGILSRSQGYDHLERYISRCERPVPCGYLPPYCSRAVAEQAVMFCMMLLRKAARQQSQFHTFNRDSLTGAELRGRKALVFGVGNIGSEVANLCAAMGMIVKGVDITQSDETMEYVDLDEGLAWADVLYCTASLTDETKGALNTRRFLQARPGLIVINVARGEITPPEDLLTLLDSGHLGGAALDVYPDEGRLAEALRTGEPGKDPAHEIILKLSRRDDVICTPHNAFNTIEAAEQKSRQTILALKRFFETGRFDPDVKIG